MVADARGAVAGKRASRGWRQCPVVAAAAAARIEVRRLLPSECLVQLLGKPLISSEQSIES